MTVPNRPTSAAADAVLVSLQSRFGADAVHVQPTRDAVTTFWVPRDRAAGMLRYLKEEVAQPYAMLYDLTAIDERERVHRDGQPPADFSLVYHLMSLERNDDVRVKVALEGEYPSIPTVTHLWRTANWYEREAWDLFGITFDGHPNLRRLLLPPTWVGHPLRKEHPARATEGEPYSLPDEKWAAEEEAMRFVPAEWGMKESDGETDYLFLNLGPHHTGTHGVIRVILQLDGERVVDSVVDIGFHHRGAEKMAERQTWHTFIPYTDRIDYLAGVLNNLPYVLAVEQLAGIRVPDRVQVIRVMTAELFRLASHLVWFGTQAQDIGSLSPLFYTFADREKIFSIIEAICGGRMHPSWFRIGGVARDLPRGWDGMVREFLAYLPKRLKMYDKVVMKNRLIQARLKGVGAYTRREAIDWGITGPGLRATGLPWDWRKLRPYSGYDRFEFDVPTAEAGDCLARVQVRFQEMFQSLRIIQQCVDHMPAGPYMADHPLAVPPPRARTMKDIETLIDHFLAVSWGPVIPPGEGAVGIEGAKGNYSYYLVSDGEPRAYRCRIRTPSFAHVQTIPYQTRGGGVGDVLAILGAIDYVLADIDR